MATTTPVRDARPITLDVPDETTRCPSWCAGEGHPAPDPNHGGFWSHHSGAARVDSTTVPTP